MAWAILIFLCSLLLSVVASIVLTRRLEQLGGWLLFSESLLGIVVALGADAPEISSAVTAMHGGRHDLGVGIVIGSNITTVRLRKMLMSIWNYNRRGFVIR
jgi:Ca2+/Na+ antiporter